MLVKKILLICMSLLSIGVVYSDTPPAKSAPVTAIKKQVVAPTDTTYANVDKPILITEKEPRFAIKLAANSTTGYQWFYVADKSNSLIIPVKQEYMASSDTKKMGSGGSSVWNFEVDPSAFKVPTISHVTLIYTRGWEMSNPVKTVELVVVTQ